MGNLPSFISLRCDRILFFYYSGFKEPPPPPSCSAVSCDSDDITAGSWNVSGGGGEYHMHSLQTLEPFPNLLHPFSIVLSIHACYDTRCYCFPSNVALYLYWTKHKIITMPWIIEGLCKELEEKQKYIKYISAN